MFKEQIKKSSIQLLKEVCLESKKLFQTLGHVLSKLLYDGNVRPSQQKRLRLYSL